MYPLPPVPRKFNPQSIKKLMQNEVQQMNKIESGLKSRQIDTSSRNHPINSFSTRFSNQDRFLSRLPSFEAMPAKRSIPLPSSYSAVTLPDRIQKERRAHTMAPLPRILGPSTVPKSKLFASIVAPTDAQAIKPSQLTHEIPKITPISHPTPDVEMSDDNTPIIVKVIYDPTAGAPPTQDTVLRAIDNQLISRSNKNNKKHPIILNLLEQNIQSKFPNRSQPPVFNRSIRPSQQSSSVRIPSYSSQQKHQNHFPPSKTSQSSRPFPPLPPKRHASHLAPQNENTHLVQATKPLLNREKFQSRRVIRLPNQNITNKSYLKEYNTFKPIKTRMSTQQSSTITTNNQQNSSKILQVGSSSNEIFRPSAVKDVPELSKENILNMLNQIPDLQGCQFNIEYAPSSAPEGYPIPLNLANAGNTYPDPVVIDQLPNNIIQHVKRSNNPAITAALEATIRREQNGESTDRSQASISTLNTQSPTVMHYTAQNHEQVQQSRPTSSNDSDSSTEVTSFETSSSESSSEETDSEELKNISSARSTNKIPFVGPAPPTSYSQKYYR